MSRYSQDELDTELHTYGLRALEPYVNANSAWRCECTRCGAERSVRLKTLRGGHAPCLVCDKKGADRHATERARFEQVMRDVGLEPLTDFPGARARWPCKCLRCGHEVSPYFSNVKRGIGICGFCAGKRVDPKEAEEIMRSSGAIPLEPFPGANPPWKCRCAACARTITPRYSTVKKGVAACKYCKGAALDPQEAERFLREAGFEPLVAYPGATKKWRATHLACGREATPYLSNLRTGMGGCHYCKTGGFDAGSPAILYLLTHEMLEAVKIGITKATQDRLKQHKAEGWKVVSTYECRGDVALRAERAVLSRWRAELGLPQFLDKRSMPQGGYTETARLDALSIRAETAFIRSTLARLNAEDLPPLVPRTTRKPTPDLRERTREKRRAREEFAKELLEGLNLKAVSPIGRVADPFDCECLSCGRRFSTTIQRLKGGHACKACAAIAQGDKRRRRTAETAESRMRAMGWEPLEAFPGNMKNWACRCTECGAVRKPLLSGVERRGPHCT
jgi:hypothetical protein